MRFPVLPFVGVYVLSFVARALGPADGAGPWHEVASTLAVIGAGGAVVAAAASLLSRRVEQPWLMALALVGALITLAVHFLFVLEGPDSSDIGGGMAALLGWALWGIGAFATTRPREREV